MIYCILLLEPPPDKESLNRGQLIEGVYGLTYYIALIKTLVRQMWILIKGLLQTIKKVTSYRLKQKIPATQVQSIASGTAK